MDNEILDKLRAERDRDRAAARAMIESKDYDPESDALKQLEQRATKLDAQIEHLTKTYEAQRAADAVDGRLVKAERARERQSGTTVQARESWGDQFVNSDQFRDYRGRGSSGIVEIQAGDIQSRALPTGLADLTAAGLTLGKTTVDLQPPTPPTPLLDAISKVPVSNNAIEFVSWAKVAGGAAVVPEKGAKPPAEWAPSVTSDTLDTIAVYTQLTRQLIEDMPSVRSYIDGELVRDVILKEEQQAAAALAAAALPTATGEDLLAAIRIGIAEVQEAGYSPNAVLMNPADWAALDVAVMSSTLVGPMVRQSFWGVTPIPSSAQPAGTAVVGDFKTAITQWYRSAVGLYITDSHADTFLSNVFTLLAERRALTAVVRPQALVEVSAAVAP
jgi:HK97 family phage major capsid protein